MRGGPSRTSQTSILETASQKFWLRASPRKNRRSKSRDASGARMRSRRCLGACSIRSSLREPRAAEARRVVDLGHVQHERRMPDRPLRRIVAVDERVDLENLGPARPERDRVVPAGGRDLESAPRVRCPYGEELIEIVGPRILCWGRLREHPLITGPRLEAHDSKSAGSRRVRRGQIQYEAARSSVAEPSAPRIRPPSGCLDREAQRVREFASRGSDRKVACSASAREVENARE